MKKLLFLLTIVASSLSMMANLTNNGYYRVENYGSQRWAFLQDNKGSVDQVAGTADVHSLGLTSDTESILTNPASIVYITSLGNNTYNIGAQGTSLQELVGYSVNIRQDGNTAEGDAAYRIYGVKSGVVKYICDLKTIDGVTGTAGLASGSDVILTYYKKWAQWVITPVSADTDNYFAASPDVTADGAGYTTLYAYFPYNFASEGMKAYYIGRVGNGIVEMLEITGDVPAETPVIIKCAGSEASDNKINVLPANSEKSPANALSGVYFDYKQGSKANQVAYDPETMRVLGTCADGSLGFVTSTSLATIPANTAYLKVEKGSPAEYKCVDSETFTAGVDTVIKDNVTLTYSNGTIYCGDLSDITVYNLAGQIVAKGHGSSLQVADLQKGVYIAKVAGKSLKIMVN